MNRIKLEKLAEIEGLGVIEMIEAHFMDTMGPGICMNQGCDYTASVEHDQTRGWCEACQTQTVKSCMQLAGII